MAPTDDAITTAPDGATTPAKGKSAEAPSAEAPLRVGDYITTASDAIPAAGLLTAKPELIEAELTATQWAAELEAYGRSERP